MQAIRRVRIAEHDDQRSVEVGAAVDLKRVGIGVAREFSPVALQKQYMKA